MNNIDLLKLFHLRSENNDSNNGVFTIIVILLLMLGLGTSLYFNFTAPDRQVVFDFDNQIDSIVKYKVDSVRNEVILQFQPRVVEYQELIESKNKELQNLREELEQKDIRIKYLIGQTNIDVEVDKIEKIPVAKLNFLKDSLYREAVVAALDSIKVDSTDLANNLKNNPTFVNDLLENLSGIYVQTGQIELYDTLNNLKYYMLYDLEKDSAFTKASYYALLKHTQFQTFPNGRLRKPELGIQLSIDDPIAKLNVSTVYVEPPKIALSLSAGIGGAVYWNTTNNTVGIAPAITLGLTKPIFNFYRRKK